MLLTEEEHDDPKKTSRKAKAIVVAVVVHVILGALFLIIAVFPPLLDEPEIVARVVEAPKSAQPKMEKKAVMKQIDQASSSSAASPIAKMLRANTTAQIAAPEVTKVSDGPLGLGEGDFGNGFGSGSGGGMGSGASFFGARSTGNRFLFVLDHSASMRANQIELRDAELEKALSALPPGVQYQVLLFAGGAFFAEEGWSVSNNGRGTSYNVKDPDGKNFPFKAVGGAMDWEFDGPDSGLPKAGWLSAGKANVGKTMDFIRKTSKFYGTDWEMALRIAHEMQPPPSVIFFMADGTGGNQPGPILAVNKKKGKPKINTFAMQTRAGAEQFMEVAEGTRGTFVIVMKDGKTVKGADYFKDPGKYNAMIR